MQTQTIPEQSLTQFMISRAETNGFAMYEFIMRLLPQNSFREKLLRHLTGFGYDAFAIYAHQQRPIEEEEQGVFEEIRTFIDDQEMPEIFIRE